MSGTTYKSRNFGHRLGNWTRRKLARLNGFEIGLAQRAQSVIPRFGYTLTRAIFLIIKIAVLATLLFISVWIVLSIIILAVFVFLLVSGKRVHVTNLPSEDQRWWSSADETYGSLSGATPRHSEYEQD